MHIMNLDDNIQVVYNAVLRANRAVLAACAPGVVWSDMHLLANRLLLTKYIDLRLSLPSFDHDVARIVLEDLTAAGILQGNVDEMMSVNLGGRWDLHQNLSIRIENILSNDRQLKT